MRKNFTLLLSLLVVAVLGVGCLKTNNDTTNNANLFPAGTFTGQFRKITVHTTGKQDTAKANIQLTLSTSTGFAVTGDTTTVHAGSHGNYLINLSYAAFSDVTYPTNGTTPTKSHLNGSYVYYWNGTVFQMQQSSTADSVVYQYDLTKAPSTTTN